MNRNIERTLLFLYLLASALFLEFDASGQAIVQIASDGQESYFVKSDGSLWRGDKAHELAKGNEKMQRLMNEMKQHPHSDQLFEQFREESSYITSDNFEPVDPIVSNGVTAVTVNGQKDVFFIRNDGSLWAMGNNEGGCLGNGTFNTPDHPIQIVPSGVKAVAGGEVFTLFLKADGSVWAFGWTGDGEFGNGIENESIMRPKQIINGGVVAIAAGYMHSLFIRSDGSLWGTGNNNYGQLGLGTNINHTLEPVEIVASNVVSVAAAHYQTLFIKSDGSLWAMGLNDWGQIGDCTINWPHRPEEIVSSNVVAVTAGDSGSLFLKKDGSLWGMGINWGSDYGEGIEFQSECPVQIFAATNSALVAGYYYNAQLKTCASLWAGKFSNNPFPVSSANGKTGLLSDAAGFPGYNLITIEQFKDGDVRLTYLGAANSSYALERSGSLTNPNWVSLVTNITSSDGVLVITNTPDTSMNNFWRIRSVR